MALSVALIATGYKSNTTKTHFISMNILIFGKDGQLGKAFHVLLDALLPALEDKPNIQYVGRSECDLTNAVGLNDFLNQLQPKLIINASAYTAVDQAEIEFDSAFAINARAPEIMAGYAASHDATFLHYSTDYVFDGEKYGQGEREEREQRADEVQLAPERVGQAVRQARRDTLRQRARALGGRLGGEPSETER